MKADCFFNYSYAAVEEALSNAVYHRASNHRYRNRRIGDFLKELHLTEGRNTGLRRYLNMLVGIGYIEAEGNTNNTVYKVK